MLSFSSKKKRPPVSVCALVYLNWAGHFLINALTIQCTDTVCLDILSPHQTSAATSEEGATDLVVVVKPSFEDFHGLLSAICLHHFFLGCMATSFNIGHHWHLFCWTSFQTGWCVYQHWLASSTVCWYEYHRLSLAVDCDSQLTHSSCCCRTLVTCLIGCNSVPLFQLVVFLLKTVHCLCFGFRRRRRWLREVDWSCLFVWNLLDGDADAGDADVKLSKHLLCRSCKERRLARVNILGEEDEEEKSALNFEKDFSCVCVTYCCTFTRKSTLLFHFPTILTKLCEMLLVTAVGHLESNCPHPVNWFVWHILSPLVFQWENDHIGCAVAASSSHSCSLLQFSVRCSTLLWEETTRLLPPDLFPRYILPADCQTIYWQWSEWWRVVVEAAALFIYSPSSLLRHLPLAQFYFIFS